MQDLSFYFTVDVDYIRGSESGVIGLSKFCQRLNLKPTFFVTGQFAVDYPQVVREVACRGYHLGTHGWTHDESEDFSSAPYEDQQEWIRLATEAVGDAAGIRPSAFRAPNLWISETTLRVLEEAHYQIDSSVPSRRLTLGYGRFNSWNKFWAPLKPYYPSLNNLRCTGRGNVLEIPPSSFILPMNMSALRVLGLPSLLAAVRCIRARSSILVFYGHPAEFVTAENMDLPASEPKRHREGIGPQNYALLERFVTRLMDMGYIPQSMEDNIHVSRKRAA